MTFIKDLEQCSEFSATCEALIAVGWLGRGSEFAQGEVPVDFFIKLKNLCSTSWQPVVTPGTHECELCQFDAPEFSDNIFIPYEGRIYVAPVGITHYIAAHWYRPPEIFIRAVLECPPMHNMEYKKAFLTNGGRRLLKEWRANAGRGIPAKE